MILTFQGKGPMKKYRGIDPKTNNTVYAEAGQSVEVSDEMGERLLADFGEAFTKGGSSRAPAKKEDKPDAEDKKPAKPKAKGKGK